jgi:hypothetical protein
MKNSSKIKMPQCAQVDGPKLDGLHQNLRAARNGDASPLYLDH